MTDRNGDKDQSDKHQVDKHNGADKHQVDKHRGIYILPNLFTTAGLFAGFYAIIQANNGHYDVAAIAIFVAMIMDGLDGRIARWTGTTSEFGKEYDSLADLIAFGLAPALVMYEWTLAGVGKVGWMAAFLYVAATALRLARFNTVTSSDKAYFQGLPCPAAAATLASFVWLSHYIGRGEVPIVPFAVAATVALALAMISNVPYRSFKDVDLKGRASFPAAFAFAIFLAIIFWEPPIVLFVISSAYAVSGPLMWLVAKVTGGRLVDVPDTDEIETLDVDADSDRARTDGEESGETRADQPRGTNLH